MRRVCYVIPSMGVGGSEQQLNYLARHLVGEFEVTIICTRRDGALAGDVRKAGVYLRVLPGWSNLGGWDPWMRRKLRHMFRAHRPDILHTFLFGFDLAANEAARETGVPIVVSSRRELAIWRKPRHLRIQRKANLLVDAVVANSEAVAEHAIKQEELEPSHIRVIPNGIQADMFMSHSDQRHVRDRFNLPPTSPIVGIVANFSPVKDHALFVASAKALLRRRKDVHFLMVGSGKLRGSVERAIIHEGMEEHFTITTTTTEIADLYGVMSVAALCSKAEGMPNAIMEAMAAGTPVVATAVGGIPELLEDHITGRLVHSRDPEDFAQAVESVLSDPERGKAMGARAAETVRNKFSVESMVDGYRALYHELFAKAIRKGT